MAIPKVTCGAHVILNYDPAPRTVALSATATNSPSSWLWTILDAPAGSTVMTGTHGDFTNGVATVQNPHLAINGGIDGTYVMQCVATNGDGGSNPLVDKGNGQQCIVVRDQNRGIYLPGNFQFDWGRTYLDPTLRTLASTRPIDLVGVSPQSYAGQAKKTLIVTDTEDGMTFGASGGGISPFWSWNETDLSEWDSLLWTSDFTDVSPVVFGGKAWIQFSGTYGFAMMTANVVPPSGNYFLAADVLILDGSSYPLEAFLCVRANASDQPSTLGYASIINVDPNNISWAATAELRSYFFFNPVSQNEALPAIWPSYNNNCLTGLRMMVGVQGPSFLELGPRSGLVGDGGDTYVTLHRHDWDYRMHLYPGSGKGLITDHGKPAIGTYFRNCGPCTVLFGNIRAYEFENNLLAAGKWYGGHQLY